MFNNLCVFGTCENIFGTFRCECNEGYQLDNTGGKNRSFISFIASAVGWARLTVLLFCLGNCTDVNECESPQACLYGECINNEGNYTCKCPPNYQLVAAGNACVGTWSVFVNFIKIKKHLVIVEKRVMSLAIGPFRSVYWLYYSVVIYIYTVIYLFLFKNKSNVHNYVCINTINLDSVEIQLKLILVKKTM